MVSERLNDINKNYPEKSLIGSLFDFTKRLPSTIRGIPTSKETEKAIEKVA